MPGEYRVSLRRSSIRSEVVSLCRRSYPATMSPERSAAIAPSLLALSRGNRQGRVRVVGGCEIGIGRRRYQRLASCRTLDRR
jgi:hypothetical protein